MSAPTLLLINPNTSEDITKTIVDVAAETLHDRASVTAVTARFGARYISSRASVAIAAHAVLDAYATAVTSGIQPDAVVIACFGDPGLDALREIAPVPVFGFADSGLSSAAAQSGSFIIATMGNVWGEMLAELVERRRLSDRVAEIVILTEAERDPVAAAARLSRAADRTGASRVILGGTGLMPLLDRIDLDVPVLDPHRTTLALALSAHGASHDPGVRLSAGATLTSGLSPSLTRLMARPL